MRPDALGFFWEDLPPVKKEKVDVRCVPPERTWEEPGYLPDIGEPVSIHVSHYMTDDELSGATYRREPYV